MSEWQTIDTAPKDGTVIIGYYGLTAGSDDMHTVMYIPDWRGKGKGQWLSSLCEGNWSEPRMWMSCPNPPEIGYLKP